LSNPLAKLRRELTLKFATKYVSTGLENPSVIKHVPISDAPMTVRPMPVIKQRALATSEIKTI
jgi:hypothetical protein